MYLVFLGLCFAVAYIGLAYLFNYFFWDQKPHFSRASVRSIVILLVLAASIFYGSMQIPNEIVGDRLLHIFGGGFLAYLMCVFVARDTGLRIGRLKFFIFSVLVITALGVGNEIVECMLQDYGTLVAATTINDTWLDLISNTAGILIGAALLTPFVRTTKNF